MPAPEPLSFATIAWRLAMRETCQTCGRQASLQSVDCPACNVLLEQLVREEESFGVGYLHAQIASWQAAGLIDVDVATRLHDDVGPREPRLVPGDVLTPEAPAETGAAGPAMLEDTRVPGAHRPPTGVSGRRRRRISLRELGESLLAERTLNTLLGLGAFLILASALVISVFNPTRLAFLPHLGVLGGTTALFYAAGWFCYGRMRLVRAGEALLGIGAAFVPLDVWSLGRSDLVAWSAVDVWAVGSALALPIYLASYFMLPGRIFAWLVAVAGASVLVSSLAVLDVSPEWVLCAAMLLALGYVLLSGRLPGERWLNLRRALFGLAHIATPPVLLVLLGARFADNSIGPVDGHLSEYAVGAAWWLGVGLYALSAFQRRRGPFKAVTAWLIPLAYLLTLTKAPWDAAWYGACLVGLAAVYAVYARRFEPTTASSPVVQVGLLLTGAAIAWPVPGGVTWALVAAFLADGLLYLVIATAARLPLVAFVSVGLSSAGFLLAMDRLQWPRWTPGQPWPWVLLMLVLAGTGEGLVRRSGEQHRPLGDVLLARGAWRAVFGPALFDSAYVASVVAAGLALVSSASDAVASSVVLALVTTSAALSAWTRGSSIFLYPACVLLPVAAVRGIHVWRVDDDLVIIGLLLAGVGAAYAWAGRRLELARGAQYRRPLWLIGLVLSVIGPAMALLSAYPWPPVGIAGVCAAIFSVTVAIVRQPVWSYPAALWMLVSYELALRAVLPDPRLEYVLAALVGPTCLALGLAELVAHRTPAGPSAQRFALEALTRSRWAVPLLVVVLVGFSVSMVGSSLHDRTAAWVSAIYAGVLIVVAVHHGAQPGERWTSLVLFALAGLRVLTLAEVPLLQQPAYWSTFALLLSVLGLVVRRWQQPSVRSWSIPLLGSAVATAALSEMAAVSLLDHQSLRTLSVTTGMAGLVLLGLAYARKSRLLAYGGVATLLGAGLMEVANGRIWQAQVYVLPVGVYAAGLAWLEWRRGDPARLKAPLEMAALLVLLGTTLLQGLGVLGDGLQRYPYDVELIVEGMVVLLAGALLHWWRSLFAGTGAIVVAVLILVSEPLATLNTWYLLGTTGLFMVGIVVLLERRRQHIAGWLDAWRERMETWS